MRVEVLFVPGCPNYAPAVARVKKILASESLTPEVEENSGLQPRRGKGFDLSWLADNSHQ
jgi:hypothetical protein